MALRHDAGETEPTWAGTLGVSERTVHNWELGYRIPSRAQALDILTRLRETDADTTQLAELAQRLGVAGEVRGIGSPPATAPTAEMGERIDAALYAAAEDVELPLRVLRAALAKVLDAIAASGASVDQARAVVARKDSDGGKSR